MQKAFSMIEVLVFTTILSLFFVVTAAVTSATVRNMQINEHKIIAAHYADELIEWVRYRKESDWQNFIDKSVDVNGRDYCFSSDSFSASAAWPSPGNCTSVQKLKNMYTRQVNIKVSASDSTIVNVSVTVQWIEPGNVNYQVKQDVVFSLYE